MSSIEIGRFSDLLRRSLGMKGQTSVAADLSPEVSPTIELESAGSQEWDFLKQLRQLGMAQSIAANVGAGAQLMMRNPAGSGVIAVISEIRIIPSGAATLALTFDRVLVDLVSTALTVARDSRWLPSVIGQQATMVVTFANATGAVPVGNGTLYVGDQAAGTTFQWTNQIVMGPGSRVIFGSTSANVEVRVSASWRERQILPMEL